MQATSQRATPPQRCRADTLVAGQQVVWIYRNAVKLRGHRGSTCLVTVEIIEPGLRRIRIRIIQGGGMKAERWVKPSSLRLMVPHEPIYAYPEE
jgi:hypothetical protein